MANELGDGDDGFNYAAQGASPILDPPSPSHTAHMSSRLVAFPRPFPHLHNEKKKKNHFYFSRSDRATLHKK